MKREYIKCDCPDEEIYLSENDGYYNLYLKSPYYMQNRFLNETPVETEATYEEVKDRLPAPYWEGHDKEVEAHDFAYRPADGRKRFYPKLYRNLFQYEQFYGRFVLHDGICQICGKCV